MSTQKKTYVSADDQIRLMRQGYKAELKLKYGELELPCRLLTAKEERSAISNGRKNVKAPDPNDRELFESLEIMKQVLLLACNVDGTPYVSLDFLEKISNPELEALYNQYQTLLQKVNPDLQTMKEEEILELIGLVKKKEKTSKDFFTWQLAEIGRFYLDLIPHMVNEPGSP